jgi:PAS domain S-box-containing protein
MAVRHQDVPDELAIFFESSPVALALAAPDGDHELLLVNRRFQELTGYPPGEAIGRNCRFLQGSARDQEARGKLRQFLVRDDMANVRTTIVNFKRDGTAFVNLLYMSRLRALSGETRFIFASQFDVSRAQPQLLEGYDRELGDTLTRLSPIAAESGIIVEGSLTTIAQSATTIAQAKLTLADLDDGSML